MLIAAPKGGSSTAGKSSSSNKQIMEDDVDDVVVDKGTDKGLATRGYKPKPGERTFEGFVKNNVPVDKETSLHTNSPGFNTSPQNANGQFKRFGTDSHGGLSPHVHQSTRNVNPKTGEIFGGQGRKTGNGGVTPPGKRDVTQLYQYLYNG
ncbi:hypothetical protein [Cytobacillus horneckiae]|uniref:hypothetical protein n=1 Tax=Cytobacillus horneckiae TaxID=549687 RepID=UPI00399FD3BB